MDMIVKECRESLLTKGAYSILIAEHPDNSTQELLRHIRGDFASNGYKVDIAVRSDHVSHSGFSQINVYNAQPELPKAKLLFMDEASGLSDTVYNMITTKHEKKEEQTMKFEQIKFNGRATIVFWEDQTKTVIKCSEGDTPDPQKAFLIAYFKKHANLSKTQTAKVLTNVSTQQMVDGDENAKLIPAKEYNILKEKVYADVSEHGVITDTTDGSVFYKEVRIPSVKKYND